MKKARSLICEALCIICMLQLGPLCDAFVNTLKLKSLQINAKCYSEQVLHGKGVDEWDAAETLASPAKINLFLNIIRKRPDNFHDLSSLFQAIGLSDTIKISLLDRSDKNEDDLDPTWKESGIANDVFSCSSPNVPLDRSNLVLKALDLLRRKLYSKPDFAELYKSGPPRFRLHLDKIVPVQAGLGGGSGNAATVLFGANKLLGYPATTKELVDWSGDIGSDITFFLSTGTAHCTGRGEILNTVPTPPWLMSTPLWIVKPSVGLSTPAVFKELGLDPSADDKEEVIDAIGAAEQRLGLFTEADKAGADPIAALKSGGAFVNDLEPPALRLVPLLADLKQALVDLGFPVVLMSGSGTSFYCLGEPKEQDCADKLYRQFPHASDKPPPVNETEVDNDRSIRIWKTGFVTRESGEGCWYPLTEGKEKKDEATALALELKPSWAAE